MLFSIRKTTLALGILAACSIATDASARDLGNFDVNVAALKHNGAAKAGVQRGDAIGRETFTWVQQDLPAATKVAARDPETAARAHLAQLLTNTKRAGEAVETLAQARVDRQRGGATLVQFQARLDGIEIFHEAVALLMDKDQRLVAMRGPLPRNAPSSAKSTPEFKLNAPQAIAAALGAYDFDANSASKLVATKTSGDYQWFGLAGVQSKSGAVAYDEQRARKVYFRTQAGLQPAWYVETQVADAPDASVDAYAHVISALDGSVLFRVDLTAHAAPVYSYRVWAEAPPEGVPYPSLTGRANIPDPDGLPTDNAAPIVPQVLRSLANIPFSRAATDGWLPTGATVTRGNNVHAYADLAAPSGLGAGDVQPSIIGTNAFDFVHQGVDPSDSPKAATVQVFYTLNWLHDWFYDHGFTEVDGNAQEDNYGRGGQGGDAIVAEVDDYVSTQPGAYISTPADGASPRVVFTRDRNDPLRDAALPIYGIAPHEWGHYLSHRLIGNASGLSTEHARGLGEGWSDFVFILMMVKEEDRLKPGNTALEGAYGKGHSYYAGRYPYSTDMSKNPLSLKHVVDGVPLPATPAPQHGADGSGNSSIYYQGAIWASMLWDCYASLLNDSQLHLSFVEAQRRMKDYIVAGMKLTPTNPTMVEARDALLATALANGQARDFELFTAAFARRGLGAGAVIPDRYSDTMVGTVESKDLVGHPKVMSLSLGVAGGCDSDAVLDSGETAKLTFMVRNPGFETISSATATLSSSDPSLTFPGGASIAVGDMPPLASREMSLPVQLGSGAATNTELTITVTPNAPGLVSPAGASQSVTTRANFDESPRTSLTEHFDGAHTTWQNARAPIGEGDGAWSIRVEGATKYLHGDDTNRNAVTWIQTPVLSVGSGPLRVILKHRHAFDESYGRYYEGGVIQASTDGGRDWTDVDVGVGGQQLTCCHTGNPTEGKKAFVGQSAGYPAFFLHLVDLEKRFAGQNNFRLRFGVTTSNSRSAGGWDIDSIQFLGLADTPFATVVPQASSCSVDESKALQSGLSGAYYLPSRSGEGVLVDFGQVSGTPVAFFSWYTYENGRQQWLVGNNTFAPTDKQVVLDLIEPAGAEFGSAFRAEDVVREPWGSASLSFPSCDTLVLSYQKRDGEKGSLTMNRGLERLPSGQCNTLHGGLSGAFYSRQRSGEGVLMDFGKVGSTPVEFFSWYTYEQGRQKWLVGNNTFAPTDGSIALDLIQTSGTGFGNAFNASDVVRTPWGKVTQRFTDCDTLELSYQKTGGESGTIVMTRGLQRLGDGQCH